MAHFMDVLTIPIVSLHLKSKVKDDCMSCTEKRYSSREAISEGDKAGVAFHDSSFFTSTRGGLKKME